MEGIEEPAQEPEDCEMNLDEDSPSNSSTNVFPPESSQQNSDENLASNCSQSSNLPNNSSETAHAIDLNTNNSSHTEITPENISHSAPSTSLPFCEPENLSGNFSESSRSTSQPEVLFEFTITPSNPTNGLFNVPIDSEIQSIINESILAQNIRFANLLSIPQVVANIIATAHEPLQLEPIPELGNVSLVLPNTESSSVEFSELFTTENILMPSSVYNGLDSVNSVVNPEFAVNAPVVDAPVVRYLHLRTIYEAFNEHLYHKIPFNGFDFTSLFPMIALSNQPNYEELVNPRPDPIFRQFLMTLSEPQREAAVRKFLVMDAVRRHMIDAVIRTIDQIPYFDRENHMLYDFAASMVLCLKSNEAEQIQYWLDLMANRGEEPAEPANNWIDWRIFVFMGKL